MVIDWKAVGQRITELRQEQGVSKEQLVELVHDSASRRVWRGPKWHPSSLAVLESGKGSILPCDILTDVARALGTSEAFLLFGVHLESRSQTEGKESEQ